MASTSTVQTLTLPRHVWDQFWRPCHLAVAQCVYGTERLVWYTTLECNFLRATLECNWVMEHLEYLWSIFDSYDLRLVGTCNTASDESWRYVPLRQSRQNPVHVVCGAHSFQCQHGYLRVLWFRGSFHIEFVWHSMLQFSELRVLHGESNRGLALPRTTKTEHRVSQACIITSFKTSEPPFLPIRTFVQHPNPDPCARRVKLASKHYDDPCIAMKPRLQRWRMSHLRSCREFY